MLCLDMLENYITNEYLRALAIFFIVFVVLRGLLFIFGKVLPLMVSKTKTNLDDVILNKSGGPLTLIAILAGIRLAVGEVALKETFAQTVEGVLLTLMILVAAVLVYYVIDAFIVIGLTEFGGKVNKVANKSLVQFFHSILKIVIFVGAFLVVLASWGIEIGPLLAGLGVAGIAIAFALQSTLSNVFGGVSMILDKSIRIGDVVKLDDGTTGEIKKINLRSTKVQTFDNEFVIVPNGKLSESNIMNIALPEPKARVVVPFGVAYGNDIAKVKKVVMKEIVKCENYVNEPEPSVKFLEMADSSLNFKAFFYVNTYENRYAALDEANTRIYNALNKAKIEIPFPQVDVHLKKK
jgi:MscS family membrane protein